MDVGRMKELDRVIVVTRNGDEVEATIVARRPKTEEVFVLGVDTSTVDGWWPDVWNSPSE